MVVVGAGFGGLTLAQEIAQDVDVTLVAPGGRFVFVPLMHEVLGESVAPPEVVLDAVSRARGARVVAEAAARVEGREVVLDTGARLPFDVCVVAVGAQPNDFGVPGVGEHALFFQTLEDAMRANAAVKDAASRGEVRVAIAGASFTGVEVAGEVHALLQKLGAAGSITLLDALPEVFPQQSPRFRQRVREALSERRMRLRLSAKIVEVRPGEVVVQDAPAEPADVIFWCAGVKPRALPGIDARVRWTLQSEARDDVFVIGDAAQFPKGANVPRLAQTAQDQARACAWNVLYPDAMRPYEPHVRGLVVSVGRHHAVAELAGGLVLAGDLPWHVKRLLYKAKIALA